MSDLIVEFETELGYVAKENLKPADEVVEVWLEGPKGPQGDPGPSNLLIQETNPGMTQPGLWIQTFPSGDLTFWVEDGA